MLGVLRKLKMAAQYFVMSTKFGKVGRHKFHGDPKRFEVITDFVVTKYGKRIKYIADIAGGRGMLTRMLNKKSYEAEVIDPRGWALKGVPARKEEFNSNMADYYDLIIGLHPDGATRSVVESARIKPTLLIPCCNFWDKSKVLGRDALILEIKIYYKANKVEYEKIMFDFKGPMNVGLSTIPRSETIR